MFQVDISKKEMIIVICCFMFLCYNMKSFCDCLGYFLLRSTIHKFHGVWFLNSYKSLKMFYFSYQDIKRTDL